MEVKVRSGFAASVVLASGGYPGSYSKGKAIAIGEMPSGERCLMVVSIINESHTLSKAFRSSTLGLKSRVTR